MKLRVLLGDDHTLLRHGLRKILEEQRDWQVVGEAGDGRDAVRLATTLTPEVAILDIGMPLLNGIDATRQIVRRVPECKRPYCVTARLGVQRVPWLVASRTPRGSVNMRHVAMRKEGALHFRS